MTLRGDFYVLLFSFYLVDVFADIAFYILADISNTEFLAEFPVPFKAVMKCIGKSQGNEEMSASQGFFTEGYYLCTKFVYLDDDIMFTRKFCDIHHVIQRYSQIDEEHAVIKTDEESELQVIYQHIHRAGYGRVEE